MPVSSLRGYDKAAYLEAHEEASKLGHKELRESFDKIEAQLDEVYTAALSGEGDNLSAEAVLALAGKSDLIPEGATFADINSKLLKMNGVAYAMGDVLAFHEEMRMEKIRLEKGIAQREGGGLTPPDVLPGHVPITSQRSKVLSEVLTDEAWATARDGKFSDEVVNPMAVLFQTTDGLDPDTYVTPQPGVIGAITKPLQVLNLIPSQMTTDSVIEVMYETVNNPQAAETAEGAAMPEAEYQFAPTEFNIRLIGHWMPVTDQQLKDVEWVRSLLNDRMAMGVMQRLDQQILLGDGSSNNLRGLMNSTGVGTLAKKAAEKSWKTIKSAATKVWLDSYARPSAIVMHPTDWDTIRTSESSAGGLYMSAGLQNAGTERLWGLPVVETNHLPAGTTLVGDFRSQARLFYRQGLDLKWGMQNDQFVKNQQTVRAHIRCAIVCYRGQAFTKVTGI